MKKAFALALVLALFLPLAFVATASADAVCNGAGFYGKYDPNLGYFITAPCYICNNVKTYYSYSPGAPKVTSTVSADGCATSVTVTFGPYNPFKPYNPYFPCGLYGPHLYGPFCGSPCNIIDPIYNPWNDYARCRHGIMINFCKRCTPAYCPLPQ